MIATFSDEVDVSPMADDDAETLATALDSAIGEWSNFHHTHGFYVQGVGRRTATLPSGWEDRLVGVRNENTNNSTGLCLDPHDLCAAKLIAGREKDYAFVAALLHVALIDGDTLQERIGLIDPLEPMRERALSWARQADWDALGE
nr:DUF6036 family nucleotidyltransferase [Arthrobacter sp. H14]